MKQNIALLHGLQGCEGKIQDMGPYLWVCLRCNSKFSKVCDNCDAFLASDSSVPLSRTPLCSSCYTGDEVHMIHAETSGRWSDPDFEAMGKGSGIKVTDPGRYLKRKKRKR